MPKQNNTSMTPISNDPKDILGQPNIYKNITQPIKKNIPQSIPEIRNAGIQLIDNSPIIPAETRPDIQESEPSQINGKYLASLLGQGVAMVGAGIAGRDPMRVAETFNDMRLYQQKSDERQKQIDQAKKLMDPNSQESKRKRNLYKKVLGLPISEDVSASDLEDPVVLNSLKQQSIQAQMAKMPRQLNVGQPKVDKEKKNPFQKEINFINIYSKNGLQALDELKKLIQSKGTSELLGASGTKIDQYIRDIAIAKTKILDPNSVISQGEIDSVKKTLGLDDYTRPFISNETAIESLDNFKNILINNRNNAINTLESLPSEESFNEKEKFIIESYRNNPDDPDTKRAYDNMLKSKGR